MLADDLVEERILAGGGEGTGDGGQQRGHALGDGVDGCRRGLVGGAGLQPVADLVLGGGLITRGA